MPKPPSADRSRQQRGSSLVEFSLVLLPLTGLLFLMLDLAWMLFAWACIQEAAREGVRTAITGQTDGQIISVVQRTSFGFAQSSPTPISVIYLSASNPDPKHPLPGTGTSCSGNVVQVVVAGVSVAPLVPLWLNSTPISLSASAADLVEPNSTCR